MQRALRLGLALAIAARATAAGADPSAPQVNPAHFEREDAQRIDEQQRGFEREQPAATAPPTAAAPAPRLPAATAVVTDRKMVATGAVLLGVAAVSAVTALTLIPLDSPLAGDSQDTYDTLLKVFAATAAISGVAGLVFLVSSRSTVRVAPVLTSRSVGLAITGRL